MTNQYEFEGKTVDDAIADGLIQLGLSRDQVDIEVLHKGSRGIFGIGSEPARVRLLPRSVTLAQSAVEDSDSDLPDEEASDASSPPAVQDNAISTHHAEQSVSTPADTPAADQASTPVPDTAVGEEQPGAEDRPTPRRTTGAEPVAGQEAEPSDEEREYDETEHDVKSYADDTTHGADEYDEISDEELQDLAAEMLHQMIHLMGFDVEIQAHWQEPEAGDQESCLMLDVEGSDLGALIGRRGETLSNIQYLLRLMINQKIHEWRNIVIDVAHYKARRAEQLNTLALRMAEQVTESGRALTLEPMPSNERRIVHMALRDHPDVYTQSTGEAERRKVNIIPKQPS